MKKRFSRKAIAFFVGLSLIATLIVGVMIGGSALLLSTQLASGAECQIQQGQLPSKVPARLNAVFTKAANEYDVQPYVIALVYYSENGLVYREPPPPYGNGKAWPTSPKGAAGPFQFMRGTWRAYRNSNPAHRPGNIQDLVDGAYAAAHYLSAELHLTKDSAFGDPYNPKKGTVMWALGAYNAGPFRGFESWRNHPYRHKAAAEYYRTFAGKSGAANTNALLTICNEQDDIGNDDTPSFSAGCPVGSPASIVRMGNGTRIKVCRVNGMVINAKIAAKWQYLIRKARADGIHLSGGGFRTASQQIALRRAHCGTSHYAIYQMPASQCTPDTARPGTSNHEKALAVDLNNARSYSSRVYRWMRANAPKIGLYCRVPGEPWHWSPSGG